MDITTSKQTDSVPALRRAVAILDMVSNASGTLNAAEITRHADLPKSTVHGLLAVMTELHLLVRNDRGHFSIGPHSLRWANSFLGEMDIVAIFKSYFATEQSLEAYTVTLTVLEHDEVVYIGCRNSEQPLGHSFRIGMRLPAPYTATGKILLAELPEDTLSNMFSNGLPIALSSKSVNNFNSLRQELTEIRKQGYSIDDGQVREGMVCIGTAIRDHNGHAIAGIAVSLLKSEITAAKTLSLAEKIRTAAQDISRQVGYTF